MMGQIFHAAVLRRQAIDALARHVAEASVETVIPLVARRVSAMGPCEARGYIRARAGREIRRQARLALPHVDMAGPSWEAAVIARASDRVAPLVLRRLAATPVNVGVATSRAA
jgi:hypothetical protein